MDDRAIMLGIHLMEATTEARRSEYAQKIRDREDKGKGQPEDGDTAANDFSRLRDRLRRPGS